MKKKNLVPKAIGAFLALVLVSGGTAAALNPRAARAVFCNLTVKTYDLPEEDDWQGGQVFWHVPYASASESQYLDLYVPDMPEGQTPQLFVLIHGGGFISNDSQSRQARLMYRYFRDHGFACATLNYRLAQETPYPGGVEDCKTAIRFLRAHAADYGYKAEQIPVWGESAGGYLANMCAFTDDTEFNSQPFIGQETLGDVSSRVSVLVDYYGVLDAKENENQWQELGIPAFIRSIANSWISGDVLQGYEDIHSFWFRKNVSEMTEEEYAATTPRHYLEKNDLTGLSAWIVHGDCDITVPYLESTQMAALLEDKLGGEAVSLHLVPGMGHASDPLYSEDLLSAQESFLRDKLGMPTA